VLEFGEQLSGRAHGAVRVVSGQAVGDGDSVLGHLGFRGLGLGLGLGMILADGLRFCLSVRAHGGGISPDLVGAGVLPIAVASHGRRP
jgi:hypothetical protein